MDFICWETNRRKTVFPLHTEMAPAKRNLNTSTGNVRRIVKRVKCLKGVHYLRRIDQRNRPKDAVQWPVSIGLDNPDNEHNDKGLHEEHEDDWDRTQCKILQSEEHPQSIAVSIDRDAGVRFQRIECIKRCHDQHWLQLINIFFIVFKLYTYIINILYINCKLIFLIDFKLIF